MGQVSYALRNGIAVVTLDNPPVNGLGHELRSGLVEALDRAAADPAVKAVVIAGAGKGFSGGADIKEFDSPKALAEPSLHTVIRAAEESPKPVVAAIHGTAMGGGLELALGCHHRVAAKGAQIALPEVKLGLLPGAGGTQRLPRAVGLETALNMIVSGAPVPSEHLARAGLFDAIVEGDLIEGAVAFAQKVADARPLPRVRDRKLEHPQPAGFLAFARNTAAAVAKDYPAPHKCIEALEAAVEKPFEEGLRLERELFLHLVQTPESRALRHAFFAERAASKIPDVPEDTPARPVKLAAVVGAGTMGGGIAMNFANAGIPVTVVEMAQDALDRGLGIVRKNYEATASRGRLTMADVEKRMGLIRGTTDWKAVADADIVIEA
ncbi:MAG TPA: enoyl-CoA hydratase-related protein, partial [Anaeromyxobacteraceae bacterium]|nr:enoyl-CoA hydratase-related protein [Anaeromyxobacteraceae bacterium]